MNNHDRINTGKILAGIVGVLLALVLIGGITVGVLSDGFKSWDKFGGKTGQNVGTVTDENGNEMESGKVYPLSRSMTFTAPTAQIAGATNGITVSATVYPEEATNKELDWAVSFVNPQSEWASGKTVSSYVTVTPDADDTSIAVIRCLNAFGERIKIRVTSRDNPDAYAECIADYGSRVTGGEFALTAEGFEFELDGVLPFHVDFDDMVNDGGKALNCELNATYDPVYTKVTGASSAFVLRANSFVKYLLTLSAPIDELGYAFGEWVYSFDEHGPAPLSIQLFDSLLIGDPADTITELHSMLVSTLNEMLKLPEEKLGYLIDMAEDTEAVREAYDRYLEYISAHADNEQFGGILPIFELAGMVDDVEYFMPLGVRISDLYISVESVGLQSSELVF